MNLPNYILDAFSGIPPKPYLAKTENIAAQTSHCNCNVAEGPVQSEGVLFGQNSFSKEGEGKYHDGRTHRYAELWR